MARIDELKGTIDGLHGRLQSLSIRMRAERDPVEIERLAMEYTAIQGDLRTNEAELGKEIVKVQAGRLDERRGGGGGGNDEWMGGDTTGLVASVQLRMLNVPTSMVHLLARGSAPLVSVVVENLSGKTRRMRVTTHVEGFSAKAIKSREIRSGEKIQFDQFPAFFPDKVATVNELTTAALHVLVEDLDGSTELHESYPIPLLARTTAVLAMQDPMTGNQVDMTPYLSAWVTPNAPGIMGMLRRAADFAGLKAMLGYQTDAAGIRDHVRAVFGALKSAEIVYVNSPISFGNHRGQFIQRVRLPRESLADRSANCIDGTVLMASLLEATGLDPAIVLVPGHAYLAWRPQRTAPGVAGSWEYVETTMIATETFEKACQYATDQTSAMLAAAKHDPKQVFVRHLPLSEMRIAGITPME